MEGIGISNQNIKDAKWNKSLRTGKTVNSLDESKLVFRCMTDEHIPFFEKKYADGKTKMKKPTMNFAPFQHFTIIEDKLVCVAKSHWKDGLENGEFCMTHGKTTDKLGAMYMAMAKKYCKRPNWNGYNFVDEMEHEALCHLVAKGLKFNEAKGDNPFSYLTMLMSNCFTQFFNKEKRHWETKQKLMGEDLIDANGSHIADKSCRDWESLNGGIL